MNSDWKIEIDTHTHTIISGHAWSTLKENCEAAAYRGLKGICLTEHGPGIDGSLPDFAPSAMRLLPESDCGVRIIHGMELNILDTEGTLDVTKENGIKFVQFGIASMHNLTIQTDTIERNTAAYVNALKNPYVDILGHPGQSYYTIVPEEIVLAAKKHDKMIEINNNSFLVRKGSKENCAIIAKLCMKHNVRVCVSSDAHYHTAVGCVDEAAKMLKEIDFPKELILNSDFENFMKYLKEREKRVDNI